MTWEIEILEGAAKELKKLDKHIALEIIEVVEKKLNKNPLLHSKPLKHQFISLHRLRIGDYRIIFRILTDEGVVQITKVGHRKSMYE